MPGIREMVKIDRWPHRKIMEDPGPRSPAQPPALRGAPYGTIEVIAENHLAITEMLRDRQDQITGAVAALVDGEEPEARASQGESLQPRGQPGTGTSRG